MTTILRRFGLGIAAALVALGVVAAVYGSTQNTRDEPASFMGRHSDFMMGSMLRTGHGGPAGVFAPLSRLASRLALTDRQKEQVKQIAQSHQDEWKALADRAIAARQALHGAVTADAVDEAVIRNQSAAVSAVEADIAVARARARAEIFQVLTPDQQAKAKAMQSKRKNRFSELRKRFEEPGQPR